MHESEIWTYCWNSNNWRKATSWEEQILHKGKFNVTPVYINMWPIQMLVNIMQSKFQFQLSLQMLLCEKISCHLPQNSPPPVEGYGPPPNNGYLSHTPNGTLISSAIFAGLTVMFTDRTHNFNCRNRPHLASAAMCLIIIIIILLVVYFY